MLSTAKSWFGQHLHVFVTADIYYVQELREFAYDRNEKLFNQGALLSRAAHGRPPTALVWVNDVESDNENNPSPDLCSPTASSAAPITLPQKRLHGLLTQTARKTTGGRAPRKHLASKHSRGPPPRVTSKSYDSKKASGPHLRADWYMNSKFCDVTIKYGPDGSIRFDGHRLILSDTSEWFQRCSNPGFTEATSRVITLKNDFPEALEALFEFCYCNTYTLAFAGKGDFEIAKNEFIQHARILVVADKYMAEGLVEYAADRLQEFVTEQIDEAENQRKSALFEFAVEQVYVNSHIFGFDPDTLDTEKPVEPVESSGEVDNDDKMSTNNYNEHESEYKSNLDDDGGVRQLSGNLSNGDGDHADTDTPTQVEEIDDFDPNKLEAVFNNTPARHPLNRLQQVMATTALNVLGY